MLTDSGLVVGVDNGFVVVVEETVFVAGFGFDVVGLGVVVGFAVVVVVLVAVGASGEPQFLQICLPKYSLKSFYIFFVK